ncbi:MAG: CsgG/HfaB family protein [Candidatus Marinimicrobia bacterium]|nr:CsgG/HfaB family protein [Candidatus Neomarinimicrobiota bacterium]
MGNKQLFLGFWIILIVISLTSCAFFSEYGKLERSAREAYSRADYDTAVFMLARSLQLEQDYEKSQILAADAFLMANRLHQKRIEELNMSSEKFRYDELVREYQTLVNLHEAMQVLPPIRHPKTSIPLEFPIVNYAGELGEAKEQAARSHYLAGESLALSEAMDDQKAAAKEFKKALGFVSQYKDAAIRYELSRKAGIKRIALFPFDDLSGKRKRYGSVEELVVDQMVTSVMKDASATEFLELISRDQLDRVINEQKLGLSGMVNEESAMEVGAILGVHEIITGKITQIIYTPVQTVHRDFKETSKVVAKTEKYKDKDGKTKTRKIYKDVEAQVRLYTRTSKAVIKGSYKIVDIRTAKLVKSEAFEGKADFSAEWVTFRGDERALKYRTLKLAKKGETVAPVAEEMVSRAAADLANSLSATIKIYAR